MSDHNKDEFQNEAYNPQSDDMPTDDMPTAGGFTTAQMRALKWMTSIMGVLIVICLILLAIGLSRNAEKLAKSEETKVISLPASMDIKALSADPDGNLWLYLTGDEGEEIQKITKKGEIIKQIIITRDNAR